MPTDYSGECNLCHIYLANLKRHKCGVIKLEMNEFDQYEYKAYYCEGCNEGFFSESRKFWKGWMLCGDCLNIPQIKIENAYLDFMINAYLIFSNRKQCEICEKLVLIGNFAMFDAHIKYVQNNSWQSICLMAKILCDMGGMVTQVAMFELDHINSLEKTDSNRSVRSMSKQGYSISDILKEVDKCRVLCPACHSLVTSVEKKSGILRSKKACISVEHQELYRSRIEQAVYVQLEKHHRNI